MNSSHILITGGAGFIGSHLAERLLAEGNAVVVVDDFSTGSADNLRKVAENRNLRIIQATISHCAELPELTAHARAIYHLAAAVGVTYGFALAGSGRDGDNETVE